MKICKKCGSVSFYANGRCKPCQKESSAKWVSSNFEHVKAKKVEWNSANPDSVKASKKLTYYKHQEKNIARSNEYRLENLDAVKASQCKSKAKNREKIKIKELAYRLENKEKIKKARAKYHLENKAACNARSSSYRSRNLEKVMAKQGEWRRENPEKSKASGDAWRAANPEAVRANGDLRRARKECAGGSFSAQDVRTLMKLQKCKCIVCKVDISKKYHVDHITPVSKNGSSDFYNLQLLCPKCNLSKSAKHPIDFMQSRGFLL